MRAIIGLGNPETKYDNTRHNTGFLCIDRISKDYGIELKEHKHKSLIGKGIIEGEKIMLVKPLTYMNLSGEALREIVDYYNLDSRSDIIVIYDDVALPIGKIRIRPKGSAGGHNGIKNIILHTGSDEFNRIRVGIGKEGQEELINHVLGKFSGEERELIERSAGTVSEAIKLLIHGKVAEAMNKYNG